MGSPTLWGFNLPYHVSLISDFFTAGLKLGLVIITEGSCVLVRVCLVEISQARGPAWFVRRGIAPLQFVQAPVLCPATNYIRPSTDQLRCCLMIRRNVQYREKSRLREFVNAQHKSNTNPLKTNCLFSFSFLPAVFSVFFSSRIACVVRQVPTRFRCFSRPDLLFFSFSHFQRQKVRKRRKAFDREKSWASVTTAAAVNSVSSTGGGQFFSALRFISLLRHQNNERSPLTAFTNASYLLPIPCKWCVLFVPCMGFLLFYCIAITFFYARHDMLLTVPSIMMYAR